MPLKLAKLDDGPEIFHTIQGEGPSVGMPAVFIRASRCNLHCHWCDTDHTWNFVGTPWPHAKDSVVGYAKHRKEDVTVALDPVDAAERILAFRCGRAVITGGEPLLQQEGFLEMIVAIRRQRPDYRIEVETNGTRMPTPEMVEAVDQFNVSPKLANSGMAEGLRVRPEVLRALAANPRAWFKFVVARPGDLEEILRLCADHGIVGERVSLMPEGRTAVELDLTAGWLAESCRDLGLRFCDRLHVRLWGDRRGV